MKNLSTTATRSEAIARRLNDEQRTVKTIRSEHTIDGESVDIVRTYSRGGKRIALVEDEEGDQFEVFFEQLD